METEEEKLSGLIEIVADFMHDQWSHWMKYLFTKGQLTDWSPSYVIINEDEEDFILWREYYNRWTRQMNTPYLELSEKEKDFDREWAKKLIEQVLLCGYCKKRVKIDICNTCRTSPNVWGDY